ncbi:MFS transporter [Mycobacterium sp. ACS1612]|uniref:YbfB/YjiJ family MFS transporter n=1 Tax=Mycobacterium sp. ACS1612 TaxID=1834117 RepID=UPI0008024CF3|nr:YbfB/YjiJ family MFS transporter [Mycobacterium sp. ACS1612]OBF32142.1 MFS transporter [Mycobacterium sp. ACS1612]
MHVHWAHVGRSAAGLGAAMGIGRFAYTPILPLMTAQTALGPKAAGALATANYIGYLAGALAGTASPRLARSAVAWRTSLVVLVFSLAAMPLWPNMIGWLVLRTVAGFASAVVFVIAVNSMMEHLPSHLPGWGFGGVGLGIALSGALVLAMPAGAGWQGAWWTSAALAALLGACAWTMRGRSTTTAAAVPSPPRRRANRWFALLFVSYTLEGIGYIIAGTFLVAAIRQTSAGWLGGGAWIFVGLAAVPSAALWAWLCARWSHPTLLVGALLLQAVGIALPAMASGPIAAFVGATLFGATFIGVSTMALAAGRLLGFPGAVALLTSGYSVGQIVGPIAVTPLLHHGFSPALLVAAAVVLASATVAGLLRFGFPSADADPRQVATPRERLALERRG